MLTFRDAALIDGEMLQKDKKSPKGIFHKTKIASKCRLVDYPSIQKTSSKFIPRIVSLFFTSRHEGVTFSEVMTAICSTTVAWLSNNAKMDVCALNLSNYSFINVMCDSRLFYVL